VLVIDTHTHIGKSENADLGITADHLLAEMDRYGVDVSFVLPLPSIVDFRGQHDDIARVCAQHPQRLFGVVSIPPWAGRKAFDDEARRCVEELGFIGFKYHTYHYGGPLLSPKGLPVLEAADKYDMPLMVHTGSGAPWALPSMLIPAARKFPKVKIIAAHSGMEVYAEDAIVAAQECENIILETSWTSPGKVLAFIKTFGPKRVVMASDLPSNLCIQKAIFDWLPISEEEKYTILCSYPVELFKLQNRLSAWQRKA